MAGQFSKQLLSGASAPAPRWHFGTVLIALVPVLSCGLLTFVPAVYLAVLRRTVSGWVALGVLTVLTFAEWAAAALLPQNDPRGPAMGGFAMGLMLAGSLHFFTVLRRWQARTRWETQPQLLYPAQDPYPAPNPYPAQASYPVPNPYSAPSPYLAPVPAPQPYRQPQSYDQPLTEDVGAELRRLSERLDGGPGDGGSAR